MSAPYVLFLMIKFRPTSSYYTHSGGATLDNRRIHMLITVYKCLNMEVFLNILKTCLLCVSLYTLLEELIFYLYVNLPLLLMALILFVTLHLRNAVLPVLSKILERHVAKSLKHYLNDSNLIYKHQSAFRENHSTETALLKLIDELLFTMDTTTR